MMTLWTSATGNHRVSDMVRESRAAALAILERVEGGETTRSLVHRGAG